MAEFLGIGMTHYPALRFTDEHMASYLQVALNSGKVPEHLRDEKNWPAPMRAEWGNDKGLSAAKAHRSRIVGALREIRQELDAFRPDVIVVFGDDQYENFKEEVVPPFCVFILDEVTCTPFQASNVGKVKENVWGEGPDTQFKVRCHEDAARQLTEHLIKNDFDVAYSYRSSLPVGLAHAFINTVMYLDYDRKGFDYPLIPFHLNSYGSRVIQTRGGWGHLLGTGRDVADPPSPNPRRCFDIGREIARFFSTTDLRVAMVASASWTHAFQNAKGNWINPDVEGDRKLMEQLRDGETARWRDLTSEELGAVGNVEFAHWVALAGAMSEVGQKARIVDYVDTYMFNSNKCFALFPPNSSSS